MALHHKLKKVIHPNRYFIWALAAIVIVALALLAYILRSSISFDQSFVFSEIYSKRVYTDAKNNFSLRYPGSWQLERDSSGNVIFENPGNLRENVTVSAISADNEKLVRSAFKIISERHIARANLKIDLIIAKILKDGAGQTNLAFIRGPDREFYLFGDSPLFESFVNNFRVTESASSSKK